MKSILTFLGVFLISASCAAQNTTKYNNFWNWFSKHDNELYDFEKDQEKIFDNLQAELQKIDSNLTFEFGPKENGKREFVISADGILSSFPSVESLYASKPIFKKWVIVKFRPRRNIDLDFEIGGLKITQKDLKFALMNDNDPKKIGIALFIRGYNKSQSALYRRACYVILDGLIGEYDMETKVGSINIYDFVSDKMKYASGIENLSTQFDAASHN